MRLTIRSFLEQLPSPDDLLFWILLILNQVKPQAPLLVVSMPSNFSRVTVRSPASVKQTSNSHQGPKEPSMSENIFCSNNWELVCNF